MVEECFDGSTECRLVRGYQAPSGVSPARSDHRSGAGGSQVESKRKPRVSAVIAGLKDRLARRDQKSRFRRCGPQQGHLAGPFGYGPNGAMPGQQVFDLTRWDKR